VKVDFIGKSLGRSTLKQIEHRAKIGEIMENNPDLPYEFVRSAVIAKAEKDAGNLENYEFD